jgi:hypothetical protein
MGHVPPRWRFRLSTLLLLVVIAALATYIIVDRWKREQERRRLEASHQRAVERWQREQERR